MKKALRYQSTLLVFVFVFTLLLPGFTSAQEIPQIPPLPAAYYGSVKDTSGQGVASGKVQAYIEGRKAGEIDFSNGFYGGSGGLDPKLLVSGTEADRGKPVIFKVIVGGQALDATADTAVVWQPGDVRRVDLTVAQAPQPPQDTTPPAVVSTDPAKNATGVPLNKTISITFSEDVQAGTAYDSISVKDAGGDAVAVEKSISGKVLSVDPNASLAYSTVYTVTIPAGAVQDQAGNALAQDYTFSFTTRAASGGGGGGGGGGATTPSADKVEKPVQAGATTVAEISGNVKVEVPAGAVTGADASIAAEVVGDEEAAGAGMPLLGSVVDITLRNGTLTGNLTITLYFDKSKLGEDQEPAVFYYDEEQGEWVRLQGVVDRDKGTVTVTVDHLTLFAVFAVAREVEEPQPPAPVVSFKDMEGHWAADAVGRLAGMGVISGYPDGTFRPDREVTRAEIAAILVRALKIEPGSEQELNFKDNAAIPAWARGAVAAAVREGLVKGYPQPDGTATFEAGRSVTRAELAVLVARILEKELGTVAPAELKFGDAARIPAWARSGVGVAVAKGIVTGYPDNTFRAEKCIARAEAAVMVLRLLDTLGGE